VQDKQQHQAKEDRQENVDDLLHSQHPTNTVTVSAFSAEIYDYSGKGSNMCSGLFERTTPS
jgi:hypothetical protein